MQRTSAVGHCSAAKTAVKLAIDPPPQKPTHVMRLGETPPECNQLLLSNLHEQVGELLSLCDKMLVEMQCNFRHQACNNMREKWQLLALKQQLNTSNVCP